MKVTRAFDLDREQLARLDALARRTRVPRAQLVREAIDVMLERFEREEDLAELHRQRAEDREHAARARDEARNAAVGRRHRIAPPRRKTVDDYYAAGETPSKAARR